jgi:hypothetical protein
MRLAAIDIGTNSLHMIVVRVRPDLSFEVIDREKERVRLGAGGLDGRALTPEAMQAALQVLSKFDGWQNRTVDRVALRPARAGGETAAGSNCRGNGRAGFPAPARGSSTWRRYGMGGRREVAGVDIGGSSVGSRGIGRDEAGAFKLGVIRLTGASSRAIRPRDSSWSRISTPAGT